MLDKTRTASCQDWRSKSKGVLVGFATLGVGLREAVYPETLCYVPSIDVHIGHGTIVDISPMRDDADRSAAKQFFQPQPGCLSAWLVQFRGVDASESDALGPIAKGVTVDYVDLPTVDCALNATEWCGGLPTEHRSEALAAGSAQPFGLLMRMESLLTVRSVGTDGTPGSWFRLPTEITGGAWVGDGGIGR